MFGADAKTAGGRRDLRLACAALPPVGTGGGEAIGYDNVGGVCLGTVELLSLPLEGKLSPRVTDEVKKPLKQIACPAYSPHPTACGGHLLLKEKAYWLPLEGKLSPEG